MTKDELKARHQKLHWALDELVADYITQTEKTLRNTTVMELIEWSFEQTKNPTCHE